MKGNKGISLIALVITIVIMIVLAGVTIYYGVQKNIDTAYESDRYTEMMNVSEAIKQRALTNRIDPTRYKYVGTPLTTSSAKVVNNITYADGWYLLTPTQTAELSLESIEKEYIVNYLTGEVVSLEPVIVDEKEYYSSNDLKEVVGDEETEISDDMYDVNKGVNKPVLLKGMIPVRNVNGKWIVTNADDNRWYDYLAENKVWANVMLSDEVTIEGYTNEDIKKSSLAELDGREIETNGSMLVWLPRCTTNGSSVVYSKLLQDYTDEGYTLDSTFASDSSTGIWISKYDAELKY